MKILLSFLFVGLSLACSAQPELDSSWSEINRQMTYRVTLAGSMLQKMSRWKMEQAEVKKAIELNNQLFALASIPKALNTDNISKLAETHALFIQAFSRALVLAETNKKYKSSLERQLQDLESIENRIQLAIFSYNQYCKEYKKENLLFVIPKDVAPAIRF